MEVVFIVVVLLLNGPILSIVLVLLLEIALCRVALVMEFLAGQELIVFAAILGWLLSVLESGRVGDGCASLIGCTRSSCAGETELPNTVSESFLKLLEVRSVGRSVRVEGVQRAESGFKNSSCRASSSVVCDSLSATRVESPSSRVQRVNAALLEMHACTTIHLRAPCIFCMLHALFRIH